MRLRDRHVSARRLLQGGLLLALVVAISGGIVELWRFGTSQAATAARVEQQVRQELVGD